MALALPAIPELPAMPDWSSVPALPALPAMPVMGPPAALLVNPADRTNGSIVPDLSAMASPGWFGFPPAPAAGAPPARAGRANATTKESI